MSDQIAVERTQQNYQQPFRYNEPIEYTRYIL